MNPLKIIFGKGVRVSVHFGGQSQREKEAYKAKWARKCAKCRKPRWNHLTADHMFKEGGK